jgi:hypothetical protein
MIAVCDLREVDVLKQSWCVLSVLFRLFGSYFFSIVIRVNRVSGITVPSDGHHVSRISDFIMYSVKVEFIDQVVAEYDPCESIIASLLHMANIMRCCCPAILSATKVGAIGAGQPSIKAPKRKHSRKSTSQKTSISSFVTRIYGLSNGPRAGMLCTPSNLPKISRSVLGSGSLKFTKSLLSRRSSSNITRQIHTSSSWRAFCGRFTIRISLLRRPRHRNPQHSSSDSRWISQASPPHQFPPILQYNQPANFLTRNDNTTSPP